MFRLRAAGLDVAALGEAVPDDDPGVSVMRLHNPLRDSYKRLVFRDGRLVGGILVGDTSGAATLTAALDRPWLPATPAALLLGTSVASASASASRATDGSNLPDDAVVCACNGVSASRLRTAARLCASAAPVEVFDHVVNATRATTGCGGCAALVSSVVRLPA